MGKAIALLRPDNSLCGGFQDKQLITGHLQGQCFLAKTETVCLIGLITHDMKKVKRNIIVLA
nr:MAG TPA: hypothetical protein [Caudoviricetes sp.]